MKIHQDWWTWIAGRFKLFPERVGGNYHAERLPQTERILPYLHLDREVKMPRSRLCEITTMSGNVATKWFRYMTRLGIINYRNCGKSGVGLTLLRDLTASPYASRQGEVGDDPGATETTFLDYDLNLGALEAAATLASRSFDILQGLEDEAPSMTAQLLAARECIGTVKRQITLVRLAITSGESDHLRTAISLGGTD